MRKAVFAVAALLLSSTIPAIAMGALDAIKAGCSRDWPNDPSRQETCVSQQVEAMSSLLTLYGSVLNDDEKQILAGCLEDWKTALGQDWMMVEYCYNRQHADHSRQQSGG